MSKKDENESLIFGLSNEGKSSAASDQKIIKCLEIQRKQGHFVHQVYVDPPTGDEENEEK
ncbi:MULTISPECIES: hypothetical protein [Bacillus]|uniref:Uncharacterized protein n=1 Tax=Bacillus mycoides TaxID=1405 RepID=A0A4U3AAZ5_BACMY|nr:hypothetical protein [Bacillus mycoides]TKI84150.1 hypothetical protein FC701_15065 [Bacillus mycoides]